MYSPDGKKLLHVHLKFGWMDKDFLHYPSTLDGQITNKSHRPSGCTMDVQSRWQKTVAPCTSVGNLDGKIRIFDDVWLDGLVATALHIDAMYIANSRLAMQIDVFLYASPDDLTLVHKSAFFSYEINY